MRRTRRRTDAPTRAGRQGPDTTRDRRDVRRGRRSLRHQCSKTATVCTHAHTAAPRPTALVHAILGSDSRAERGPVRGEIAAAACTVLRSSRYVVAHSIVRYTPVPTGTQKHPNHSGPKRHFVRHQSWSQSAGSIYNTYQHAPLVTLFAPAAVNLPP